MNGGASRRGAAPALLTATLVPLLAPFFRQYWIQNHEGYSYALRSLEVVRCWRDGFWSAHWFPDLYFGQGYPFLCFYAPLSIVTAATFQMAGAHVLLALKLTMALAALLGAWGAYRLARRGLSPAAAFVAGALYTYAPYHVCNLWVRGDIAEYLGMGFLPWCLHAVLALREGGSARRIAAVGAFGAAAIVSHNLMGLFAGGMMAIAGAIVVAGSSDRRRAGLAVAAGGLLALGLAAFFWIPALVEQRYVKTYKMLDGDYAVAANFQPIASLLGLGTRPATTSGMVVWLGVGWAALPLLLVALVRALRLPREVRPLLGVAAVLLAGGTLLTHRVSSPLYAAVSLLRFAQFPWRFYSLVSLGAAILAAAGFEALFAPRGPALRWIVATFVAAAAYVGVRGEIAAYPSLPVYPELLSVERMRTQFATTTGRNEYMPRWVTKSGPPVGFVDGVKVTGVATVRSVTRQVGRYDVEVDASAPSVVELEDIYYPGWKITAGGAGVAVRPGETTGHVQFDVPAGTATYHARLELTPLRQGTAIVSALLAALALVMLGRPPRALGPASARA